MRISARGLNRATLGRQALLRREALAVGDAVRRVVAIQAQHPASPYVALWNRVAGFDPAALDAAFADGTLVKATLMRITLHVVHGSERQVLHTALRPTLRGSRLGDRRFTSSGLSAADADALVPPLLEFAARPRAVAEFEAWLGERLGVPPKGVWWALRTYAPLAHVPTGGPWSFGHRPSYATVGPIASATPDECLPTLVRRYLEGFGPASVADVAQFALVQRSRVRAALLALADAVERHEGPGGVELFDVPGALLPHEDTPAPPRLMAMWDSTLLAHADRTRVIPPEYRKAVIRANGDVLPTLLVDGLVAGVWRPVEGGVEATAFHPLPEDAWDGLAAEARSLVAFLADREPRPYRRHDHWWTALPAAEVRLLPG
ncbi:winged helix DNA-binding domain-containing protein [Saccharothrix sp. HUAS TT1]|uniref:winged helix DNA-binding domain-containing protein n=1 Tax=unclassified Saccharothrix TaxID=2593673 RepID=UPI00345BC408